MTDYVFIVAESIVSCKTELQDTVTLSTIEAEYMATVKASKEASYLRGFISTFEIIQGSVQIYCDSQSAIHHPKAYRYHTRTSTPM